MIAFMSRITECDIFDYYLYQTISLHEMNDCMYFDLMNLSFVNIKDSQNKNIYILRSEIKVNQ